VRRVVPAMLIGLLALAVPASASAQDPPPRDFIVNVTTDGGEGLCDARECTLREAVGSARPVDTVRVPAGRFLLASELNPTGDRIVGAGAGATFIDGGLKSRVLLVTTGSTSISGVTVTGGTGASQTVSGQGGGIYLASQATLSLVDSAVVGNSAQTGGGIVSEGTLLITRSTVSGNRATSLQAAGNAGGIYAPSGTATLRNSTVSGNVASGVAGGIAALAPLVLDNVTVALNQATSGGGVLQLMPRTLPDTTVDNTIIARNTGGACGGDADGIAAWKGDHNLDDDGTCGFTAAGDRPDVDPRLGPLAANGARTQTHALLTGSTAINAGAGCVATDQRGIGRRGACDIGAFEFVPPPPPPPPPPSGGFQLPPPVAGKQVNLLPARGTVTIRRPGTSRFVRLEEGAQVPVGTVVNTLKGRVTLIAASDKTGGTAEAVFYGGIFKLGQTKGSRPITVLTLVEKLSCPTSGKASTAAKRKKKRRLWGNGKGRFRTKGKHSAATVLGTKWLVEDRCSSTLTRVVRGRVSVRDFVQRKTVTVRKGKKYIARAKR
jgi:hypothetical protein